MTEMLSWGKKVSPGFRDKVRVITGNLGVEPSWLMACMMFESELKPDAVNHASGATGLIQFMPQTAGHIGTTTSQLRRMTAERQLEYVEKYFKPWVGKLKSLNDLYMAILWPAGVGKPDNYPIFTRANLPTTYAQNRGLDFNKDGVITKTEACTKVRTLLSQGFSPENVA